MDIFNISLDFFHVFRDMAIDLIKQWDKVEIVANRAIKFMENFTLELVDRFL